MASRAAGEGTGPSPHPGITLSNVSKCFFHNDVPVQALRDISLDIADGEFVSLIG